MKKAIDVIKDIFSDKRKKSGVGLLVCIVFMIFMTLMIKPQVNSYKNLGKSNRTTEQKNDNVLENFYNMKSYEVEYDINITENNVNNNYKITGTYFEDKYYLTLNNEQYYINDNNIYKVDDINNTLTIINKNDVNSLFNKIDFKILLKETTYNSIKSSEEKSKTEYKDGNSTIEYLFKNYKNQTISFIVKSNSNLINSIDYDLTNYYDTNKYQMIKVSSNYTNMNNISSYNKNYEKYTIIDNTNSNVVSNNMMEVTK